MEKLKNKQTKIIFIVVSILLIMPSIIYMIQNRTLLGFNKYYNFFITDKIIFLPDFPESDRRRWRNFRCILPEWCILSPVCRFVSHKPLVPGRH